MTTAIATTRQSGLTRLRWALSDGWTITRRDLSHWARQPVYLIFGMLFPVMVALMFAYLWGGQMDAPGGDYTAFLMPGMFAMTMVFGIESTFTAVTTDINRGVTDRFRSMPMSRSAVLTGRCTADLLYSVLILTVLIGCGLAMGWSWHNGLGDFALAIALLLWLRISLLWLGIFMALVLNTPEALMAVQIIVWPLGFLSSVYVEPSSMPGFLGTIAEWNPLSSTVSATRELFGNPGWGGDSWIAQNGLLMATLWPLLITLIFFPLSIRAYQRLSR